MTGPNTAREALIAEAIGEVVRLINRVELLKTAMEEERLALGKATSELDQRLDLFDRGMAIIAEQVKTRAVHHIARRTDELATRSMEAQRQAMREAACAAFTEQIGPVLAQHARAMQQCGLHVRPWETWLTHAATAVCAAVITWLIAASFAFK
jgi:hypothetical protein